MLQAIKLCKDFGPQDKTQRVLTGISVDFQPQKTYAITGVSGSGKSTLIHVLGGLDTPTSGTVLLGGQDIFSFTPKQKSSFLNQKIGVVFQFHYLVKELSVVENIMMPGLIAGLSRALCHARALELLKSVDLLDKQDQYPTNLSGGQQQRVAIARAVFNKPEFLLADEPTGNLDADNAAQVVDLLLRAQREWGMGVILCSHDRDVYSKMEHVYHLHNGLLELMPHKI